jgi:hypothetical protein
MYRTEDKGGGRFCPMIRLIEQSLVDIHSPIIPTNGASYRGWGGGGSCPREKRIDKEVTLARSFLQPVCNAKGEVEAN